MDKINFFWDKGPLWNIGKISLASFLNAGHPCILWSYSPHIRVPKGVEVRDASEIVSYDTYQKWLVPQESVEPIRRKFMQAFSDYFRFKLLFKYGGWWCDADVVCLKPFVFEEEYVFAWADWPCSWITDEMSSWLGCRHAIQSGVLKMPAKCGILAEILSVIERSAEAAEYPVWFEWIKPLTTLLPKYGLVDFVQKRPLFDPLGISGWERLYEENMSVPDWAYSVHGYTSNGKRSILPGSFLALREKSIKLI